MVGASIQEAKHVGDEWPHPPRTAGYHPDVLLLQTRLDPGQIASFFSFFQFTVFWPRKGIESVVQGAGRGNEDSNVCTLHLLKSFWRQPLFYVLPSSSNVCYHTPRDFNSTHAIRCFAGVVGHVVRKLTLVARLRYCTLQGHRTLCLVLTISVR